MFWVLKKYFAHKLAISRDTRYVFRKIGRKGIVQKEVKYNTVLIAVDIIIMLLFCWTSVLWWNGALAEEAEKPRTLPSAIVTLKHVDGALNVRTEPNLECRILLKLANGAIVVIEEERDGWALVNFPRIVGVREPMGWVWTEYLTIR